MNYLLYLRKTQGMTLKELSKRTHTNMAVLSQAENGFYAKPPKLLAEKLSVVYGPK